MTPAAVRFIKAKPGRYAISDAGFDLHGRYFMVEVALDGTIYQLNPQGKRDGVLSDEHWLPNIRVYHVSESRDLFVRVA